MKIEKMAPTVVLQDEDQGGLRIQTSYNVPKIWDCQQNEEIEKKGECVCVYV